MGLFVNFRYIPRVGILQWFASFTPTIATKLIIAPHAQNFASKFYQFAGAFQFTD
jgi:hypothetical protein